MRQLLQLPINEFYALNYGIIRLNEREKYDTDEAMERSRQ